MLSMLWLLSLKKKFLLETKFYRKKLLVSLNQYFLETVKDNFWKIKMIWNEENEEKLWKDDNGKTKMINSGNHSLSHSLAHNYFDVLTH